MAAADVYLLRYINCAFALLNYWLVTSLPFSW